MAFVKKSGKKYIVVAGTRLRPGRVLSRGLTKKNAQCRAKEINRRQRGKKK